jgi:hypothetical protein
MLRKYQVRWRVKDQRRRLDLPGIGARELVGPDEIEEIVGVGGQGAHCSELVERGVDREPVRQRLRRVAAGHRGSVPKRRCPLRLICVQRHGFERGGETLDRRVTVRVVSGAPFRIQSYRLRPTRCVCARWPSAVSRCAARRPIASSWARFICLTRSAPISFSPGSIAAAMPVRT